MTGDYTHDVPVTAACWGLSNFTLIDVKRTWGPVLRFTLTWIVDLADGRCHATSIEGFRYRKKADGTFHASPPVAKSTNYNTIYTCMISTDLLRDIEAALVADGWQGKVGRNYAPKALLDLPVNI